MSKKKNEDNIIPFPKINIRAAKVLEQALAGIEDKKILKQVYEAIEDNNNDLSYAIANEAADSLKMQFIASGILLTDNEKKDYLFAIEAIRSLILKYLDEWHEIQNYAEHALVMDEDGDDWKVKIWEELISEGEDDGPDAA